MNKEEEVTLKRLQKPIFDDSLFKKDDGTVSGSLLTVNAEEPFLCTPLDVTESNLLAWLMRDSQKGSGSGKNGADGEEGMHNNRQHRSKYEKRLPDNIIRSYKARYASQEAKEYYQLMEDYHHRRELNRILASRLELGTAMIDEDGRLLPLPNNNMNDGEDNQEHGGGHHNNIQNNNDNFNPDEDVLPDDNHQDIDDLEDENQVIHEEADQGLAAAVFGNAAQEWLDEEEERRRQIRRQEADAEEVIANAVKKYRNDEVPEDDFFFVPIPSRGELTFNL